MVPASYHWSRVASALRLLVADDYRIEAGCGGRTVGVLLSSSPSCARHAAFLTWNKAAGGDTVFRVGVMVVTTWMDNQGNGALNELVNSKFQVSPGLEMSAGMKRMGMKELVEISPEKATVKPMLLHTEFATPSILLYVFRFHRRTSLGMCDLWLFEGGRKAEHENQSPKQITQAVGTLPDRGKQQRQRQPKKKNRLGHLLQPSRSSSRSSWTLSFLA